MKALPGNVLFYINHETKGSYAATLLKVILKISLGREGEHETLTDCTPNLCLVEEQVNGT